MATISILLGSMAGLFLAAIAFLFFGAPVLTALSIWAGTGIAATLFGALAAWGRARSRDDDGVAPTEETV